MDYIRGIGEALNSYNGVLGSKRKVLSPQELRRWNHMFLVLCVIALSLDPLFCYILVFNGESKCLRLDTTLGTVAIVLRSIIDLLYIFHITFQFRASIVALPSQPSGQAELVKEIRAKTWRYFLLYFPVDIFVILPLPQVVIFAIVPKLNDSRFFNVTKSLNFIVIVQYVLRVLRICSLLKKVTSTSGILAETAWANLSLYMLASHVVGAFWYLFSIERKVTCWQEACKNHAGAYCPLYCDGTFGTRTFLNDSCSIKTPNSTIFDFGIYFDALESGVVDSADFVQKISYCFWWGLQNLSSLGQGLKTSTYVWEIYYAAFISISGLVLFSSLIGNMQTYLQLKTARLAEVRLKEREAEDWMAFYTLPQNLKKRIREFQRYKWQETLGVNMENFLLSLPKDLRSDTKRYLFLGAISRVPLFEKIMDEHLLDAMCDRLKPVLYTEESYIFREGGQVDAILFIMRGRLVTITNGGRLGYFNSEYLTAGDVCGEELFTCILDVNSDNLLYSTRSVQALSEVEALALNTEDLMFLASNLRRFQSRQLQHRFRYHSEQWRTWAASYIQAAWRCHCKKKLEEALQREEKRLQDALVKAGGSTSSPTLGSTIYALRFAANALSAIRHKERPLLLQKPAELNNIYSTE